MCKDDGGSDGGIHVHIHGCGCGKERPLHVHVHLDCDQDKPGMRLQYGVFTPQPSQPTPVHVKPNGNFICVRGKFDNAFTSVRAQIYRIGDVLPPTPPYTAATGQLVNHSTHPTHTPCLQCNYVFEAAFGNEVGNARCGSGAGDSNNRLRIWIMNASSVVQTIDMTFSGICGNATACGGTGSASAPDAPEGLPEEVGPRLYMLDVAGEMNDRQTDPSVSQALARRPIALMRRDATAATGVLVWESVEETKYGQWELTVISQNGRRVATLEYAATLNPKVRRLWIAPQWEFFKANEVYPAAIDAQLSLPVLVVQPSWTQGA